MSATFPPLRDELRGIEPYGAPQLDVPVQLNVNENPYGPSPECAADIARAVAAAATTLNRYPDREFTELRSALAAYLGHGVTPDQVWAARVSAWRRLSASASRVSNTAAPLAAGAPTSAHAASSSTPVRTPHLPRAGARPRAAAGPCRSRSRPAAPARARGCGGPYRRATRASRRRRAARR